MSLANMQVWDFELGVAWNKVSEVFFARMEIAENGCLSCKE